MDILKRSRFRSWQLQWRIDDQPTSTTLRRCLCHKCREPWEPSDSLVEWFAEFWHETHPSPYEQNFVESMLDIEAKHGITRSEVFSKTFDDGPPKEVVPHPTAVNDLESKLTPLNV